MMYTGDIKAGFLKARLGLSGISEILKKSQDRSSGFQILQCRHFGRAIVSYSETNWQESFDLIHN